MFYLNQGYTRYVIFVVPVWQGDIRYVLPVVPVCQTHQEPVPLDAAIPAVDSEVQEERAGSLQGLHPEPQLGGGSLHRNN